MEHGLNDIAFYVQKHIAHWAICYNFLLVQNKPLGVPTFVRLVYYDESVILQIFSWWHSRDSTVINMKVIDTIQATSLVVGMISSNVLIKFLLKLHVLYQHMVGLSKTQPTITQLINIPEITAIWLCSCCVESVWVAMAYIQGFLF